MQDLPSEAVKAETSDPLISDSHSRWKSKASADAARKDGMGRMLAELQQGQPLSGVLHSSAVLVEAPPEQASLLERLCFGRRVGDASGTGMAKMGKGPKNGQSADDRIQEAQTFELLFEEAFFLGNAAGCLNLSNFIGEGQVLLSWQDAWQLFQARQSGFVESYVAYHHLRAKRWVVRPGVQYGADFMAYRHHPAYVHSDYAVLVMREAGGDRIATWTDVQAMARLCGTVAKTLLLMYVLPAEGAALVDHDDLEILSNMKVEEVEVRRWVPGKQRDGTDDS